MSKMNWISCKSEMPPNGRVVKTRGDGWEEMLIFEAGLWRDPLFLTPVKREPDFWSKVEPNRSHRTKSQARKALAEAGIAEGAKP